MCRCGFWGELGNFLGHQDAHALRVLISNKYKCTVNIIQNVFNLWLYCLKAECSIVGTILKGSACITGSHYLGKPILCGFILSPIIGHGIHHPLCGKVHIKHPMLIMKKYTGFYRRL